jgi:hypothetical protein
MKAKITWSILLLMATGLAGSSKNFCGKNCRHGFTSVQGTISIRDAVAPAEETGTETLGISPINLFIFQLK